MIMMAVSPLPVMASKWRLRRTFSVANGSVMVMEDMDTTNGAVSDPGDALMDWQVEVIDGADDWVCLKEPDEDSDSEDHTYEEDFWCETWIASGRLHEIFIDDYLRDGLIVVPVGTFVVFALKDKSLNLRDEYEQRLTGAECYNVKPCSNMKAKKVVEWITPELPRGWKRVEDADGNLLGYWNEFTRETREDRPEIHKIIVNRNNGEEQYTFDLKLSNQVGELPNTTDAGPPVCVIDIRRKNGKFVMKKQTDDHIDQSHDGAIIVSAGTVIKFEVWTVVCRSDRNLYLMKIGYRDGGAHFIKNDELYTVTTSGEMLFVEVYKEGEKIHTGRFKLDVRENRRRLAEKLLRYEESF